MDGFVDVAAMTDVPVGRAKAFSVGERRIAICHTPRGFFALDNTCPHRGGPLAEGDLIGDEIVCPWHLWGFNVATGVCDGNRSIAVTTHEIRIEADRILVKVP